MALVTAAGSGCMITSTGCGRSWTPSCPSSSLSSPALFQCKGRSSSSLFQGADNGRRSRWLRCGPEEPLRGGAIRSSAQGDDSRDDAGVIKDMELILDDLSLEYNSVWDTKPAWYAVDLVWGFLSRPSRPPVH